MFKIQIGKLLDQKKKQKLLDNSDKSHHRIQEYHHLLPKLKGNKQKNFNTIRHRVPKVYVKGVLISTD